MTRYNAIRHESTQKHQQSVARYLATPPVHHSTDNEQYGSIISDNYSDPRDIGSADPSLDSLIDEIRAVTRQPISPPASARGRFHLATPDQPQQLTDSLGSLVDEMIAVSATHDALSPESNAMSIDVDVDYYHGDVQPSSLHETIQSSIGGGIQMSPFNSASIPEDSSSGPSLEQSDSEESASPHDGEYGISPQSRFHLNLNCCSPSQYYFPAWAKTPLD